MSRINSQDRINEKLSPRRKRKGGKAPLLISTIAGIAVLTIVIVATALGKSSNEAEPTKRNTVVTPENVEEVIKDLKENEETIPVGQYTATMNGTWTFETGESISKDAFVENDPANTNDVRFTVTLADSGEEILSSPVLPLGSRLENISLDKALPAGSYECIITYYLLDDQGKDTSSVKLNLNIMVKH